MFCVVSSYGHPSIYLSIRPIFDEFFHSLSIPAFDEFAHIEKSLLTVDCEVFYNGMK